MLNGILKTGSTLAEVAFWLLLPVAVIGLVVTGFLFFGALAVMFGA